MGKPAIPGKGEIGTAQRTLVEEPQIRAVPAGSEKIVTATPGAEGSQQLSPGGQSTGVIGPQNIAPGVGLPNGAPSVPGGGQGQALLSSFGPSSSPSAPAAEPSRAGAAPRSVSGGPLTEAKAATGSILPTGASTSVNAPVAPLTPRVDPLLGTLLGNKVIAAPSTPEPVTNINPGLFQKTGVYTNPQGQITSYTPTALQQAAGTAGKVLSNLGLSNIGNQLQNYGGAVNAAASGQGSISNILRSIGSTAQNTFNNLRSALSGLFRW